MPASFYDLMKYAKTGIASPDMTDFDKRRALAAFGGYPVNTITGVPPLSFRANGKPLISWNMLGNGQQNGTPAPDAPIMPTFCGDRTKNLFDGEYESLRGEITAAEYYSDYGQLVNISQATPENKNMFLIPINAASYYTISFRTFDDIVTGNYIRFGLTNGPIADGTEIRNVYTFQNGGNGNMLQPNESYSVTISNSSYKYILFQSLYIAKIHNLMLNTGSTALHYEPYGYKLPITCAGQTTPIYLGQTQTVRRIKKLVLTGKENWTSAGGGAFYALPITLNMLDRNTLLSTHFFVGNYSGALELGQLRGGGAPSNTILFNYDNGDIGVENFKSWLADQYVAGTPVVIWYVLATPTTAIVNEPLAKIGDYADELHSEDAGVTIQTVRGNNTLSIGTSLQPSSVSITGHIKV